MRYPVWGLRRGSGPRSGSARPPSHLYRGKVRYRTATDYGPGICIRVRIPYRTVRIRILILLGRIKIKLLSGRIRVQYSDPDLPGLVRLIRALHSDDVRCPRWRGQSMKTTTGPKSGLKIKICLKIKVFASSGSQRVRIRGLRIRDSDPGLGSGPKSGSGLKRWHQSGKADPWLVAGSDPDCVTTNRDRDTTYVGTGPDQLPLAKRWKEKGQFY
jgi:hypothetical protein